MDPNLKCDQKFKPCYNRNQHREEKDMRVSVLMHVYTIPV